MNLRRIGNILNLEIIQVFLNLSKQDHTVLSALLTVLVPQS
jgi:predicted transcriptional regulator